MSGEYIIAFACFHLIDEADAGGAMSGVATSNGGCVASQKDISGLE
jgi:hypothetical protein